MNAEPPGPNSSERPLIRRATPEDWPAIWAIFHAVVATGTTYAFAPDMPEAEARQVWTQPPARCYVALAPGTGAVVGTMSIKPNQPGLGNHIANGAFMVARDCARQGIGRALGQAALAEARQLGFTAMQFNFVVSTNTAAVALWQSLGFAIVGTVPGGFRHRTLGPVDIYIMHQAL